MNLNTAKVIDIFGKGNNDKLTEKEKELIAEKLFIEKELIKEKKRKDNKIKEEKEVDQEAKGIYKEISRKKGKPFHDPLLIQLRPSGDIKITEKVTAGHMEIKREDGSQVKIFLNPKKIYRLPAGDGEYYRCWVHNEMETFSYPHDIEWDSKLYTHNIVEATTNYRENWDIWGKIGKIIGFKTILIGAIIIMVIMALILYSDPTLLQKLGLSVQQVSQVLI